MKIRGIFQSPFSHFLLFVSVIMMFLCQMPVGVIGVIANSRACSAKGVLFCFCMVGLSGFIGRRDMQSRVLDVFFSLTCLHWSWLGLACNGSRVQF